MRKTFWFKNKIILFFSGVWKKILEPIKDKRKNADLVKMFPSFITGEEMFGLTEPNILKVIESVSHLVWRSAI